MPHHAFPSSSHSLPCQQGCLAPYSSSTITDAASNLTLKKDRNARLTAYSFDDLNRLESDNWLTGTTSLPSLAVATTTQGGPVNEVQRVGMTVSTAFTSGTFTLSALRSRGASSFASKRAVSP